MFLFFHGEYGEIPAFRCVFASHLGPSKGPDADEDRSPAPQGNRPGEVDGRWNLCWFTGSPTKMVKEI